LNIALIRENKKPEFFTDFIDVLKTGKYHSIFTSAKQDQDDSNPIITYLKCSAGEQFVYVHQIPSTIGNNLRLKINTLFLFM